MLKFLEAEQGRTRKEQTILAPAGSPPAVPGFRAWVDGAQQVLGTQGVDRRPVEKSLRYSKPESRSPTRRERETGVSVVALLPWRTPARL